MARPSASDLHQLAAAVRDQQPGAVELARLALADADIVLGERRALALRVHHDGILAVYGEAVGELVEALEGLPGSRVSTAAAW